MVSFLDLKKINGRYREELINAVTKVIDSGWYLKGQEVAKFEEDYARFCGVKHCIGVGNGLDALRIILQGYIELGKLKPGDEIIVPANTFIATALAVSEVNLIPVLADPNPHTFNLDAVSILQKITPKTKAVLMVNLYGQITIDETIQNVIQEHDLLLIEDAAQSVGAVKNNKVSGAIGHASGVSFYPGKNLGALGDAGAITTNDSDLANVMLAIGNYGSKIKYEHEVKGLNSRLDEVQAAILNVKLKYVIAENEVRQQIANKYLKEIDNQYLTLPICTDKKAHVWHLFVVKTKVREQLVDYLNSFQIQTIIHYPKSIHQQRAYSELNSDHHPISETLQNDILSLPISPVMTKEEVEYVIDKINRFKI